MEAYQRYGPLLRRKCERMLRNQHDAEDVVQSVFLELIRRKKTQVDLPYLYRAVTNRCLNLLRDAKRRTTLLKRRAGEEARPAGSTGEEQAVGLDLLVKLASRLDNKSLEILSYHLLDDMTQEEIGELMKLSRKSVNKRLSKIRRELDRLRSGGGA